MIQVRDTVLRRRDESRSIVSKNPLPEYKGTVGAIITEEEFEESSQYIVDENEVIGIVEKPFVLEEELLKIMESLSFWTGQNLWYLNFLNNHLCIVYKKYHGFIVNLLD